MRTRLNTIVIFLVLFCAMLSVEGCYSRAVLPDAALLSTANPQNANIESASYVIRAGDRIKISAIDYMEFDTTSIVSETGTISIKLIGDLHIEGVTRVQAEKMIAERIGVYAKSPTILVDISVVKGADARIVMLGSIARPDTFTVTAPISLVESLAIAGGTQTDADLRRIKIFRHDPAAVPLVFDLTNFVSSGTVRDMPKVGPGDIVFVPRDENFLRDFFGYLRDTLFLFGFFSIAR